MIERMTTTTNENDDMTTWVTEPTKLAEGWGRVKSFRCERSGNWEVEASTSYGRPPAVRVRLYPENWTFESKEMFHSQPYPLDDSPLPRMTLPDFVQVKAQEMYDELGEWEV